MLLNWLLRSVAGNRGRGPAGNLGGGGCRLLALSFLAFALQSQTLNPQYQVVNPPSTDPASPSWSTYQFSADFVPPFDYEFVSLIIGNHSFHQNSYTPRGSPVSSSSALLIGWTTPTDADCLQYGCRVANGQSGITVSLLAMNRISPTVGIMLDVNPGVDSYNGVWGFNVNASNHFHSSTGGSGIFGGEVNIGLDDMATDIPNPGVRGQSLGIAVTESSQNRTGKRLSAAFSAGVGGTQNFHHGFYVAASPTAQTPMDDLVHAKGPINVAIDLHEVKSGPVAQIMPPGGGLQLGTVSLPLPTTPTGTLLWCRNCSQPACTTAGNGALAISTGAGYRCY
jgi:hypothetical protein